MADIVSFPGDSKDNTGYKYFAKAVLESLWNGAPEDTPIQVVDKKGRIREIVGAQIMDGTVTMFI